MTARTVVAAEPEPIDIQAKARAEIAKRDWRAVHVNGDRSPPVQIADRPRRRAWGWERWR